MSYSRRYSSFVDGMDDIDDFYRRGENGALELTAAGVESPLVALFFALVRGVDSKRVEKLMDDCLHDLNPNVDADLFVMAFQTRDCRGGKGERKLFYVMYFYLYKMYPSTALKMLPLFGEYGYFKDLFCLAELTEGDARYDLLRQKITDVVANQLIADEASLDQVGSTADSKRSLSMCSKYAPREGKHFAKGKNASMFADLVNKLFPSFPDALQLGRKQYRQLISKLTKALDVPEVKMCGKRFGELDFAKVPSLCAKKCTKAFLNEKIEAVPTKEEFETGNRHPNDADRVQCRQHLRQAAVDLTVKGKQLYPHDIVETLYNDGSRAAPMMRRGFGLDSVVSDMQKEVLNAQWIDIRQNVVSQLAASAPSSTEAGVPNTANAVNLGKLVPLSDVSGSMEGIPMLVSIALGILVSEVNHPAFRDRVLSFDSDPTWVDLSACTSIDQKVEVMRNAPWGGSTDITKAFQRICDVVRTHRLPAEEVPDLIVFSDMQFDQASASEHHRQYRGRDELTQLELVRSMFHNLGVEICGTPYPAPKIVFWNLRGDTAGFPAQAEDENVQMLSGFSPSLLKYVLEGAPLEEEVVVEEVVDEETGQVVKQVVTQVKPTPYQTLRRVLDAERYHPVRRLLGETKEGCLAGYQFTEPPPPAAVAAVAAVGASSTE